MVERVVGRVDRIEVVFQHVEGDLWQLQVPFDEDCTYILEIMAIDEAGNETFITKMMFIYDASNKTVILKPIPYSATLLRQQYFGERILTSKEVGGCIK